MTNSITTNIKFTPLLITLMLVLSSIYVGCNTGRLENLWAQFMKTEEMENSKYIFDEEYIRSDGHVYGLVKGAMNGQNFTLVGEKGDVLEGLRYISITAESNKPGWRAHITNVSSSLLNNIEFCESEDHYDTITNIYYVKSFICYWHEKKRNYTWNGSVRDLFVDDVNVRQYEQHRGPSY